MDIVLSILVLAAFALLIGDAAHATTPNMGQGACQAIEDAVTLGQCLADATTIETAFADFEKKRLKRTAWITNTSWNIGRMAQLENPFLISVRNAIFRLTPPSLNAKQLAKLNQVDFKTTG